LHIELVDLRDQLVDVFSDVLSALVRVAELFFELANPLAALTQLDVKSRVRATKELVPLDERTHRTFQALEIVVARVAVGNEAPPLPMDRTGNAGKTSRRECKFTR
jgi:hypothetical protein